MEKEKRKMGRPKKRDCDLHSKHVMLNLTQAEYENLTSACKLAGISIGVFLLSDKLGYYIADELLKKIDLAKTYIAFRSCEKALHGDEEKI